MCSDVESARDSGRIGGNMSSYRTKALSAYTRASNRLANIQAEIAAIELDMVRFRHDFIVGYDMEKLPSAEWKFKAELEQTLTEDEDYRSLTWQLAVQTREEILAKVKVDQVLQVLKCYRSEQYARRDS